MPRRSGRNGLVALAITGTGAASKVLGADTWKLSYKVDKIDVTAFGDANKVKVAGFVDLTGSFTAFWDSSETKPLAAAKSTSGGYLVLYADYTNDVGAYCAGPAVIDWDMDASGNGAPKVTATFEASGDWYLGF
jgi:hypothetical protein